MHTHRTYRELAGHKNLCAFSVTVKETDLQIYAERHLENLAQDVVIQCRGYLENYIHQHPSFASTLAPFRIEGPAPEIVKEMAHAGQIAGVGPMAAVAGAVAEFTGLRLMDHSRELIVENGGDVFIHLSGPFTAGIYAGRSPLSMKLGLRIDPAEKPISVCTSSGTIGHSKSFGKADAVCVVSASCALADAAATAIGNQVHAADDITEAIAFGKSISNVKGVVIIVNDKIGLWGDLEVVPLREKRG